MTIIDADLPESVNSADAATLLYTRGSGRLSETPLQRSLIVAFFCCLYFFGEMIFYGSRCQAIPSTLSIPAI